MKRLLLLVLVTLLTLVAPTFAADKNAKAADKMPMAAQKAPSAAEKLDLNTATEQELAELPGIGEVRSIPYRLIFGVAGTSRFSSANATQSASCTK